METIQRGAPSRRTTGGTRVDHLDGDRATLCRTGADETAGLFSNDPEEIARFLDRVQAGVTYVNRRGGATTGAWPGYQSFGGWKGSSSTCKAAGSFYYVQQYMREQSRTVIELGESG